MRLALAAACALTGLPTDSVVMAAGRRGPKLACDYREAMVADFEPPLDQDHAIEDNRITWDTESGKATRGKGCLKIELTADGPVKLGFILPAAHVQNHDWLEYDLIGGPPGSVLIETTLAVEGDQNTFARTATVVGGSPWRGQLLLSELAQGRTDTDLRIEFGLTLVGPETVLYFDALRMVRDNPPSLPPESGGAYDFGRTGTPSWPGFSVIDSATLRTRGLPWEWQGRSVPQISSLGWPDPIMRTFVGGGAIDTRDMSFSLSLQLRGGQYEGVIFAAPVMLHGLKRGQFGLKCNGWELVARRWSNERMFSEEGVFAGRNARDFTAEAVHRLWVDRTFHTAEFSLKDRVGRLTIDSMGTFLAGLVIYPRIHHRAFRAWLDRLADRRRAYFAQQVYSCLHPSLSRPLDTPTASEKRSGLQLIRANLHEITSPEFSPTPKHLARDRLELFGLAGQTVTAAIGVAALEDLDAVAFDVKRSRRAKTPVRVTAIREFPVMSRPPLRRAVPFWLSPAQPRTLKRGQIAWHLLEIDLPRSVRGKHITVDLQVGSAKRSPCPIEIRVLTAQARLPSEGRPCRGVAYPPHGTISHLLSLHDAPRDADVGALMSDDYRLLNDYGVKATTIHGLFLSGNADEPRAYATRALMRARIAGQAGMCSDTAGWVDFGDLATARLWQDGPDGPLMDIVAGVSRQVRLDLSRMKVRGSALLAGQLDPRTAADDLTAESTVALARVLRDAGWRSLGVMFNPMRLRPIRNEDEGDMGDLIKVLGQLDRVAAPSPLAEQLRKRWPDLQVELLDTTAGRFSAGFRLWLGKFDGLWTAEVHRRTIPYMPLDLPLGLHQPLLMPFPGQPAPTLRLLAIREGCIDHQYINALTQMVAQRRKDRDAGARIADTLEAARDDLTRAWEDAVEAAWEELAKGHRAGTPWLIGPPTPPHALMDKHRRALFDRIAELSRRR